MLNQTVLGLMTEKYVQPKTAAEAKAFVAKMKAQARSRTATNPAARRGPHVVPSRPPAAGPKPTKAPTPAPVAFVPAPKKADVVNLAEIYTALNATHDATPEARDRFLAEGPLHGARSHESRLRLAAEGRVGARW